MRPQCSPPPLPRVPTLHTPRRALLGRSFFAPKLPVALRFLLLPSLVVSATSAMAAAMGAPRPPPFHRSKPPRLRPRTPPSPPLPPLRPAHLGRATDHRSAAATGTATDGPPSPWPSSCRPPHAKPRPPSGAPHRRCSCRPQPPPSVTIPRRSRASEPLRCRRREVEERGKLCTCFFVWQAGPKVQRVPRVSVMTGRDGVHIRVRLAIDRKSVV